MKKFLRIIIPVLLVLTIIVCSVWYLFVYDRELTRDLLLGCARRSENNGYHDMATWFYNRAYSHDGNSDAVAIELAHQYIDNNNYSKAEYTLSNAISDGGGIDVYIELCKTFIAQDKLLDAVNMLDGVTDPSIRADLDKMRPAVPIFTPDPDANTGNAADHQASNEYDEYISVSLTCPNGKVYATVDGTYPSISDPYKSPIAMKSGMNIVRTIAVSDNGLVSALGERKYLIKGVVEEVVFVDSAVEAEVRNILGVTSTKKLMTSDLWEISEFTIPAGALQYADLRHMINLEVLTIVNGVAGQFATIETEKMPQLHRISITGTDVSQDELKLIAELPALRELTLSQAGLSGISPLKDAVKLTKLDISGNSVGVLDPIKYLSELEELNLSNNAVTDLSAISKNTQLRILNISYNQIVTLAPITSLTNLTHLTATDNRISVLGDIGKLSKLNLLNLNNNQLNSLTSIGGCVDIVELYLENNQLTDISALSAMPGLMHLDFSNNLVSQLPEFPKNCSLVTIDGSFNLLSDLSQLSDLPSLNTVNIESNVEITSLEPLAGCRNLFRVNVLDTKVTEVRVLTDKSIAVLYRQPEITTESNN